MAIILATWARVLPGNLVQGHVTMHRRIGISTGMATSPLILVVAFEAALGEDDWWPLSIMTRLSRVMLLSFELGLFTCSTTERATSTMALASFVTMLSLSPLRIHVIPSPTCWVALPRESMELQRHLRSQTLKVQGTLLSLKSVVKCMDRPTTFTSVFISTTVFKHQCVPCRFP